MWLGNIPVFPTGGEPPGLLEQLLGFGLALPLATGDMDSVVLGWLVSNIACRNQRYNDKVKGN